VFSKSELSWANILVFFYRRTGREYILNDTSCLKGLGTTPDRTSSGPQVKYRIKAGQSTQSMQTYDGPGSNTPPCAILGNALTTPLAFLFFDFLGRQRCQAPFKGNRGRNEGVTGVVFVDPAFDLRRPAAGSDIDLHHVGMRGSQPFVLPRARNPPRTD
jgi:hypothetical protein